MISIFIPNNFVEERTYTLDVILAEFLGLNYQIETWNQQDYKLRLDNNQELIIRDSFFSALNEKSGYLMQDNIPSEVNYTTNDFIIEDNLPILYGTELINVESNQITCWIDLFASSFFMLTRWEEYVNLKRDNHDRFSAANSLSFQHGLLDRPIVNEYTEMLWNMLKHLGIRQERRKRSFEFIATHDVDHIERWTTLKTFLKNSARDVLKNKNFIDPIKNSFDFLKVKTGIKKDPYDTFDKLMHLSEQAGIKSHFYFMSGGVTKNDNFYSIKDSKTKKVINKIKDRGHVVGFHPSYAAYNDHKQWKKEKELLEQITDTEIKEGRQHYLRFENPTTWQIWHENGMQIDSTLSYADAPGFRCGTCYEFPIFNIITRKVLELRERPLIAMEISFSTYQMNDSKKILDEINYLINQVKKYNGTFVFLWHNSSFSVGPWKRLDYIYEEVIKKHSN